MSLISQVIYSATVFIYHHELTFFILKLAHIDLKIIFAQEFLKIGTCEAVTAASATTVNVKGLLHLNVADICQALSFLLMF